jgi:hypothetical protein
MAEKHQGFTVAVRDNRKTLTAPGKENSQQQRQQRWQSEG